MSRNGLDRSVAVYRLLLLFYPRAFRASFGAEMTETFRDRCRAARKRGVGAFLLLWPGALWDAARHGLTERVSAARAVLSTTSVADLRSGLRYDFAHAVRALARRPRFAF